MCLHETRIASFQHGYYDLVKNKNIGLIQEDTIEQQCPWFQLRH